MVVHREKQTLVVYFISIFIHILFYSNRRRPSSFLSAPHSYGASKAALSESKGEMGPAGRRRAELSAFPGHKKRSGGRKRERKSESCWHKFGAASRVQSFSKLNKIDSHLFFIKIS